MQTATNDLSNLYSLRDKACFDYEAAFMNYNIEKANVESRLKIIASEVGRWKKCRDWYEYKLDHYKERKSTLAKEYASYYQRAIKTSDQLITRRSNEEENLSARVKELEILSVLALERIIFIENQIKQLCSDKDVVRFPLLANTEIDLHKAMSNAKRLEQIEDVIVSIQSVNLSINFYFGGIGDPDGPGHGHISASLLGYDVIYRRGRLEWHGVQNFIDQDEYEGIELDFAIN